MRILCGSSMSYMEDYVLSYKSVSLWQKNRIDTKFGHWWGTAPAERKQTEIDIMGEQDKDTALSSGFGSTCSKVAQ